MVKCHFCGAEIPIASYSALIDAGYVILSGRMHGKDYVRVWCPKHRKQGYAELTTT